MRKLALIVPLFVFLAACSKQSPPEKPIEPAGPTYCTTAVAYTYKVSAIHPQGQRLEFQFDWGGTVSGWSDTVASGETLSVNHTFDTAGNCDVAARARDSVGVLS